MQNLKLIHFFLSLFLSSFAWSETPCSKDVLQLYRSSFHNPFIYKKGSCPTNIWNFLKVLETCQIPISDEVKVIYITENNLNVFLDQGRGGADRWYFHVVLYWKGLIFDFDYTDEPAALIKKDYFQKALTTQAKFQWQGIQLRMIPAQEYLLKYDVETTALHGFYYWLLPERSSYPEISIPGFIK